MFFKPESKGFITINPLYAVGLCPKEPKKFLTG
jgi:hypothetical protein